MTMCTSTDTSSCPLRLPSCCPRESCYQKMNGVALVSNSLEAGTTMRCTAQSLTSCYLGALRTMACRSQRSQVTWRLQCLYNKCEVPVQHWGQFTCDMLVAY